MLDAEKERAMGRGAKARAPPTTRLAKTEDVNFMLVGIVEVCRYCKAPPENTKYDRVGRSRHGRQPSENRAKHKTRVRNGETNDVVLALIEVNI